MAPAPSYQLFARLEPATTEVPPGGTLRYTVINTGEILIMLGEAYVLEQFTGEGWEPLRLPYFFRLWGRRLQPGLRCELAARIPEDVHAGTHRLRKRLQADRDPHPESEWVATARIEPIEVSAEFHVRQ